MKKNPGDFFPKKTPTMSLSRAIKASKNTHKPAASASGRTAYARASKDIALSTEWKNAMDELVENQDQVPSKRAFDEYTQSWIAGDWGDFKYHDGPAIPKTAVQFPNPPAAPTRGGPYSDGRMGDRVNIKSFSTTNTIDVVFDNTKTQQDVLVRRVYVIDKQANEASAAVVATDVFDQIPSANTNNLCIVSLFDMSNQERFKIISDETHKFNFNGNGVMSGQWFDHFDLDYTITFANNSGTGIGSTIITNRMLVFTTVAFCTAPSLDANGGPGVGSADVITTQRYTYLDDC